MRPQRVLCGIRPWVATCTEAGGKWEDRASPGLFPASGFLVRCGPGPAVSASPLASQMAEFALSSSAPAPLPLLFPRAPDSPRSFAYGASLMSTRPQTAESPFFSLPRSPGPSLKPRGCSVITAGTSEPDAPHSHVASPFCARRVSRNRRRFAWFCTSM